MPVRVAPASPRGWTLEPSSHHHALPATILNTWISNSLGAMLQSKKNFRGIIAMVIAMACFVVNDTFVKVARLHWETGQVLFVRGLFALAILTIWLGFSRSYRILPMVLGKYVLARGALKLSSQSSSSPRSAPWRLRISPQC